MAVRECIPAGLWNEANRLNVMLMNLGRFDDMKKHRLIEIINYY